MSNLPLVTVPDDFLRQRSREVTREELASDEIQTLIDNMIETMHVENGVGIAAPQVGEHLRIIIVQTEDGNATPFINPKITDKSFKKVKSEEGCLSVPGVSGIVQRHRSVSISALDRNGDEVTIDPVEGFTAIIFQHEIDHIDGVLFIDRAKKIQKATENVLV